MFENIIGNEKNKKYLENLIKTKKYTQSYIFSGKEGIGKQKFAKEFIKNIICENQNDIIKFDSGTDIDFMQIEKDGSSIKIGQIRELEDHIEKRPVISNKKGYIINDFSYMTEEAQNALLKTLESPPEYAIIILIVSNESQVLPTIKSRCVTINFSNLTNNELKQILPNVDENVLKLLDGSMKNYKNIEQLEDFSKQIEIIIKNLQEKNLSQNFIESDFLYNSKENINQILDLFNIKLANKKMYDCISIIENTKQKILKNNNYEMTIDYLIINLHKILNKNKEGING